MLYGVSIYDPWTAAGGGARPRGVSRLLSAGATGRPTDPMVALHGMTLHYPDRDA
jgi:hypothetical protein